MKTTILTLGLLVILICSTFTITAKPTSTIRLPTDLVTMNAIYGKNSWFTMTLSDIPQGFDITNGTYPGWCVQKTISMTQKVNHTVLLYSSTSLSLPHDFQNKNWDKINYILNHKHGNRKSIQKAIWYYTNNEDCSTNPDAQTMVNEAESKGTGFIPTNGEIIAIPIEGVPTIQLTFLELTIPLPGALEGLVWSDSNANGIQNEGEPGLHSVLVRLYQSNDTLISTTMTDTQGYYSFETINPGEYYLQFTLPTGYTFSPQHIGSNDTLDSDADITTGKTTVFTVYANESITTYDAGMYKTSPTQNRPRNHPPTADASAREPYKGDVHTAIIFDGSRSYDRDGRIISYRWIFGDGTNGTGVIATHTYETPGNYTVTLTVLDNWFAPDTYTTTARIVLGNNPPTTPLVTGPLSGHTNISYQYTMISTDPDNDMLQYIILWGDGTQNTTQPLESGQSLSLSHLWNARGFYTLRIYAQDSKNAVSDVYKIVIPIDVLSVGNIGYLIDINSDGIFDMFHSNTTGKETKVGTQANGNYLIDSNGDGTWDVIYNLNTHQISSYQEIPAFLYDILIILVIVFVLLFYLLRIKRRSITSDKPQDEISTVKNKP